MEVVGDVVNRLDRVEGLDVSSFFEGLGALAVAATQGATAQQRLHALPGGEDTMTLTEENEELRASLENHKRELTAQRERFSALLRYFRQLMEVNRAFLGLTSVTKVSSLSNYIRELSRNVEDSEKWMLESK